MDTGFSDNIMRMRELGVGILNMHKNEILCLLFAILFSLVVFIHFCADGFYYDEASYIQIASSMSDKGFTALHPYSDKRTYAYPCFLYILQTIRNTFHLRSAFDRYYVFCAQLLIYIFIGLYVRARIIRLLSLEIGKIIFCVLMLNIFNLIYLAFVLTEILSIAMITLYLLAMIELFHKLFVSNKPIKWNHFCPRLFLILFTSILCLHCRLEI